MQNIFVLFHKMYILGFIIRECIIIIFIFIANNKHYTEAPIIIESIVLNAMI